MEIEIADGSPSASRVNTVRLYFPARWAAALGNPQKIATQLLDVGRPQQ
jgi:hypothetical protein